MSEQDDLMAEAFAHLEAGDPESALEIGKRLESMQYSGAYEVQAMAYADMDEVEQAVAVLEAGVAHAPGVWLLWQLLGNYRSDLGRFPAAIEAYEAAGNCAPDEDLVIVDFNHANALARHGDFSSAQTRLDRVLESPHLAQAGRAFVENAIALRMHLFNAQGEPQAAIATYEALHKHEHERDDEGSNVSMADVLAELSLAHKQSGNNDQALASALEAVQRYKWSDAALWALRAARDAQSDTARTMHLIVEGQWYEPLEDEDPDGPPPEFVTTYDVVAEDEAEALRLIAECEPPQVRDSLRVVETHPVDHEDESPTPYKGVYATGDYHMYQPGDDID
ncbi:tetratricopeptide repeat protein [Pandoraea sp.]|uniref:tetratricopeptide repeat protein n=1 Tax=Pandoraea sp. TaxID=1883445 RepID=UPI0035B1ADD3